MATKVIDAERRAEFWSFPDAALVDRLTLCAVTYQSLAWAEQLAIRGGGPRYMRLGRKALYRKLDILNWMTDTGRSGENTAQFA
jgi:hypothetical protein